MLPVFEIASIVLYFIVGVICLSMAYVSMFSKKYLPFHEEGAGMKWEAHGPGLQATILTLFQLSVPLLALVFCAGLAYFNYQLHKKTKADTPWQSSIAA